MACSYAVPFAIAMPHVEWINRNFRVLIYNFQYWNELLTPKLYIQYNFCVRSKSTPLISDSTQP